MTKKKILLLTLVHPDFLPPVHAIARVLRDEGYVIDIVTFASYVPAVNDADDNIVVHEIDQYYGKSFFQQLRLRKKFVSSARKLVSSETSLIISFCPVSFLSVLKFNKSVPHVYIALEIRNFRWSLFAGSPLTQYRNLRTIKKLHKADLVATPSVQRSAWLAGRANLTSLPLTIFNTAYFDEYNNRENHSETFKAMVPVDFIDKKIILYTGNVNPSLCIKELVEGFCLTDNDSRLIITGIKDNDYCSSIRDIVARSGRSTHVLLLPSLSRDKMLALQANAGIGACFSRELDHVIESKILAPNKVGEYLSNGSLVLGNNVFYLQQFAAKGVAVLSESIHPQDIASAISLALQKLNDSDTRQKVYDYFKSEFCMQRQLLPVINYLKQLPDAGK